VSCGPDYNRELLSLTQKKELPSRSIGNTEAQFFSVDHYFSANRKSQKSFAILLPKSRDQDRRRHQGTKFSFIKSPAKYFYFLSD